jgi:hypothetical protein
MDRSGTYKEPEVSTMFSAGTAAMDRSTVDDACDITDEDLLNTYDAKSCYREPETSSVFSVQHDENGDGGDGGDGGDFYDDGEEPDQGDMLLEDASQMTDADLMASYSEAAYKEPSTTMAFVSNAADAVNGDAGDDFGEFNEDDFQDDDEFAFDEIDDTTPPAPTPVAAASTASPSKAISAIPAHVRTPTHMRSPPPPLDTSDDGPAGPAARDADGKETHKDAATMIQEALAEARALSADLKPEVRPFEAMLSFPSPVGIHGILKNSPNYAPLSDYEDDDDEFFDDDEGEFVDPDDYDENGNFIGEKPDKSGGRVKKVTFGFDGAGW